MKSPLALLLLTALSLPVSAIAAQVDCAFGSSTADLTDQLDQRDGKKDWYKGEHLSVHSQQRLQGLTKIEKDMILMAVGASDGANSFDSFISSEGYITYFSHNSNGREFAMVASYPGDNEFGLIIELKKLNRKQDLTILSVAAVISDSDFEDCKVLR